MIKIEDAMLREEEIHEWERKGVGVENVLKDIEGGRPFMNSGQSSGPLFGQVKILNGSLYNDSV